MRIIAVRSTFVINLRIFLSTSITVRCTLAFDLRTLIYHYFDLLHLAYNFGF